MNHIAAALLLALGNKKVDEKGIKEVLNSVGTKPNAAIIEMIVGATKGKSCDQV